MNRINVAVVCEKEHKASIYTLVTSIVRNKDILSDYCIYMLLNNTDKELWIELSKLVSEHIEIVYWKGDLKSLENTDKVILLKWNTLVTGDLSELYHIDLEGNAFAVSMKHTFSNKSVSVKRKEIDSSVMLIDTKKYLVSNEYKVIPMYYNFGYEEYLHQIPQGKKTEFIEAGKAAVILRLDERYPADIFFDGPLSLVWMSYYKDSPIGNQPLNRIANMDTKRNSDICHTDIVPLLINVDDKSADAVMDLLHSLDVRLDVRLTYNQLSMKHQKRFLGMINEKRNIVLYHIKKYTKSQKRTCKEIIATMVCGDYEKVICVEPGIVKIDEFESLGRYNLSDAMICVQKNADMEQENEFLGKLTKINADITVINPKLWIENQTADKLQAMLNDSMYAGDKTEDILNLVCLKNRIYFAEKIRYDKICAESNEDNNVKEVLEQIKRLEESNQNLMNMNKKLKADNRKLEEKNRQLNKERERFLFEILEIRKSVTYKIGRAITLLPRKLRGDK